MIASQIASPATVVELLPLTDRIVVVHFNEGHVIHSGAGQPEGSEAVVVSVLNTNTASQTNSYQVFRTNDPAAGAALHPVHVGRRSKGTDFAWNGDPAPLWIKEHWLYFKLPQAVQRGKTYTINTGEPASNGSQWTITFEESQTRASSGWNGRHSHRIAGACETGLALQRSQKNLAGVVQGWRIAMRSFASYL